MINQRRIIQVSRGFVFFHWRRFHENFRISWEPRTLLPAPALCACSSPWPASRFGKTRSADPAIQWIYPPQGGCWLLTARMTWHHWKIGNPELNLHVWLLLGHPIIAFVVFIIHNYLVVWLAHIAGASHRPDDPNAKRQKNVIDPLYNLPGPWN